MRIPLITPLALALTALAVATHALAAQSASFVYRLGKDTVAIEQYTRTATALTGEMVQRAGGAVARFVYTMELGSDGRPASATIRRFLGDGSVTPNAPTETRIRITADSVVREAVWADSVQRRAFAAARAMVNFPTFIYGPTELLSRLRRSGGPVDSLPALGIGGTLGSTGFSAADANSARLKGGAYAMLLQFDASDRLQSVDGSGTTNKVMASRGAGGLDLAAIARLMTPTGTLSVRDVARGAFGAGGMVLVDYGRPQVRDRTVWGGTLVPFDSVWRAGANDATHLFTTRTLALGSAGSATLTLSPGMYSLWVQHTREGTFLIVNRQTGQWGTQYDAAQDVGRVLMQLGAAPGFVEELTYAVRTTGPGRGALDLAWGPSVATVPFTATVAR